MAFLRRAISRVFLASSFFVPASSSFVSLNSSFKGLTMLSIRIRVACSALSMRTDSASASDFDASAFAFLTVARREPMAATVPTRPPPRTMLMISLMSMPLVFMD